MSVPADGTPGWLTDSSYRIGPAVRTNWGAVRPADQLIRRPVWKVGSEITPRWRIICSLALVICPVGLRQIRKHEKLVARWDLGGPSLTTKHAHRNQNHPKPISRKNEKVWFAILATPPTTALRHAGPPSQELHQREIPRCLKPMVGREPIQHVNKRLFTAISRKAMLVRPTSSAASLKCSLATMVASASRILSRSQPGGNEGACSTM